MNISTKAPKAPREFYDKVYIENKPCDLEWTAGTPSPELINLVWEGVLAPGMEILEVGTGLGTESVFLAVRGMKVSAVDLSTKALEYAQKLADFYGVDVALSQGDATDLKFPQGKFDVVSDQGVFHHLSDGERLEYANSVANVLKPGGMLLLRSFSDKIPGGPQPRRIKSDELIDTLHNNFILEHMSRSLSFTTSKREKPLGWHTIWFKR